MAKRRATDANGVEEYLEVSSPASKRARHQDPDEEVAEGSRAPTKRANGKGKAKGKGRSDDEESEEEDEVKEEDEDDERRFEEEHEEAIRAAVQAKSKVQGGIADMGIIESLELHQFMCHKYLTFSFGPQVNFIIGHNGSGKSAVLSSITVALGGKATSTGRGSGLKSFIREGQSVSEVSVSLKNQGEEAYKPDLYGKSIVITRRFTREGSSSYKIKSRDGKVISTKREELAAICDHMNIQVDNPMNILTQDSARQFLSASHPSDKYRFFLKGTQLQQLSDEYDTILGNIAQTAKTLTTKREGMSDLRSSFKEATARFEEAHKAREQKHKADELKKELAWAHVATKEDEMRKKMEEVAKLRRRLPKLQDGVDTSEAEFRSASEKVGLYETELQELGDIEDLHNKKKELGEKIRSNKTKIADYKEQEKQMDGSLKATNKQIVDYDARIQEETRKLELHTQAKRDENNRKLKEAQDELHDAEKELARIRASKQEKITEMESAKSEGEQAGRERDIARELIMNCQNQAQTAKDQEKNNLAVYGNNMKGVLEQIKQTKWCGRTPVGPLGIHVKVKDPQKWAGLLRVQLGGYMSAFSVTDARDQPTLKRILDRSNNNGCMVFISEYDLFDYSDGEPPANTLTVLRAIEADDPYVLRILINAVKIERTVLAENRSQGDQILDEMRGGGTAWTADMYRVQRYGDGGGMSSLLQRLQTQDRRHQLFTGRDSAAQVAHWESRARDAEAQHQAAVDTLNRCRRVHNDCNEALKALTLQEKQIYARTAELKLAVNALLNEINDDLPAAIGALQAAKDEAENEKTNIIAQFTNVAKQRAELDEAQKPLLTEQNALKKQINEYEEQRVDIRTKIEETVTARLEAQKNKNFYVKKLEDEQAKVKEVEEQENILQEEFQNWTAKAEEYCQRVNNPRKVEEVQRNLNSVQAALKEREKKHGATVEEMTIEVNKRKAALDNAEKDLKQVTILNKTLKASLVIRLAKWHDFRRHIALRCKVVFQYHLSNRGYYGKVLFDHSAGTLQLKVQTDDQAATQTRDKDPRSLSGGEKSFSTICLLLSLWEAIGCPIRCLDEFDVFMDAVNRRISMKMMIDTANSSDGKQYILITPQDMNNVAVTTTVRVHRMSDPERGQGVLAFS